MLRSKKQFEAGNWFAARKFEKLSSISPGCRMKYAAWHARVQIGIAFSKPQAPSDTPTLFCVTDKDAPCIFVARPSSLGTMSNQVTVIGTWQVLDNKADGAVLKPCGVRSRKPHVRKRTGPGDRARNGPPSRSSEGSLETRRNASCPKRQKSGKIQLHALSSDRLGSSHGTSL